MAAEERNICTVFNSFVVQHKKKLISSGNKQQIFIKLELNTTSQNFGNQAI
jgi:hypothetical protein